MTEIRALEAETKARYLAAWDAGVTLRVFYTRVVVHDGPDRYGRYRHTRYWMADYHPGHPEGEYRTAERGQVFFAPLPAHVENAS